MQVKIEPSGAAPVPATSGNDAAGPGATATDEARRATERSRIVADEGAREDASRLALSLRALAEGPGAARIPGFLREAVDVNALAERLRSEAAAAVRAQGALDPARALALLSETGPEITERRVAEIATAFENRLAATLEAVAVDEAPAAAPLAEERIAEIRARIEAWRASTPWAEDLA
ncbi:MAG: hypothetical protein AAGC67_21960 [Myxococcota bacterium]